MSRMKSHFGGGACAPTGSGRGNWKDARVCPICGHKGYCQLARDGATVLCHYVESGHVARDGSHVHHLEEGPARQRAPRFVGAPRAEAASALVRDAAYRAALAVLSLAQRHREQLLARGLDGAAIALRGYASLEVRGRAALARAIVEAVGEHAALAVPGIVRKEGEHGDYLSLAGAAGLLIPVRDHEGRIVALCVRRDETGDGPKYCVVSSAKHGGASPGAPVHHPMFAGDRAELVLTEGILKSDLATHLAGRLVLGLPGVNAQRAALEAVERVRPARVVVAFDADAAVNPHVARAQAELVAALRPLCPRVALMRWDPRFKGLDDALLACAQKGATR